MKEFTPINKNLERQLRITDIYLTYILKMKAWNPDPARLKQGAQSAR